MPGTIYYITAIKRASASTWFHFPPLEREIAVEEIIEDGFEKIPFGTKEPNGLYGCTGFTIDCNSDYYYPDERAGLVFQHKARRLFFDSDGTGEELDFCGYKDSESTETEVFRKCHVTRGLKFSGGKSLRWKHISFALESRDTTWHPTAAIGGAPGPGPFEMWTGRGQTTVPIPGGA